MSKRFTATDKWDDPWFHSLTKDERTFWTYLLDRCDHAGIWDPNLDLLEFHTGLKKWDLTRFEGRIIVLTQGKWFIPGFVQFHYGNLNDSNRAHLSVIKRLKNLNLWPIPLDLLKTKTNQITPLLSPSQAPCKPLGSPMSLSLIPKEVVKEGEKHIPTRARLNGSQDFDRFWLLYPRHVKKDAALKAWQKLGANEELRALMYRAIEEQKKSEQWIKDEGRYIPYPASWLNGRRWEDELPTSRVSVEDESDGYMTVRELKEAGML